mmetsp:Transcript_7578/g.19505  ORF Transcript_7578/g.19505 Transcript_7578/m.19505 type:complete len:271 (+) Transcript_7578:96-908(+)
MKGRVKKKRPLVAPPLKSLRKARKVTSAFHELTAELQAAKSSGSKSDAKRIQEQIDQLGGREAYQDASVLTTSRAKHTSKWVFSELTRLGYRPGRGEPPLKVLEVGAVNTQILSVPWLQVRAIDINSCHPRIEQIDFFNLAPAGVYFAVVCSMVINCVPTPEARGDMMRRLFAHTQPGGLVFLTLPLRCLTHAKAMTWRRLVNIAQQVGFTLESCKTSPKIAFFCLRRPVNQDAIGTGGVNSRAQQHEPPAGAKASHNSAQKTNTFAITF